MGSLDLIMNSGSSMVCEPGARLGHSLLEAYPQERKRGADRGIDGLVYFVDGPRRTPRKAEIQVRGGRVAPSQIRDLKGVVERGKAALGLFITLEEPTREMRTRGSQRELLPFGYLGPGFSHNPDTHSRGVARG